MRDAILMSMNKLSRWANSITTSITSKKYLALSGIYMFSVKAYSSFIVHINTLTQQERE